MLHGVGDVGAEPAPVEEVRARAGPAACRYARDRGCAAGCRSAAAARSAVRNSCRLLVNDCRSASDACSCWWKLRSTRKPRLAMPIAGCRSAPKLCRPNCRTASAHVATMPGTPTAMPERRACSKSIGWPDGVLEHRAGAAGRALLAAVDGDDPVLTGQVDHHVSAAARAGDERLGDARARWRSRRRRRSRCRRGAAPRCRRGWRRGPPRSPRRRCRRRAVAYPRPAAAPRRRRRQERGGGGQQGHCGQGERAGAHAAASTPTRPAKYPQCRNIFNCGRCRPTVEVSFSAQAGGPPRR